MYAHKKISVWLHGWNALALPVALQTSAVFVVNSERLRSLVADELGNKVFRTVLDLPEQSNGMMTRMEAAWKVERVQKVR